MIITQTPLRISFIGGGSDFPGYFRKHGGVVISSAIDKFIFVIVKERFDDEIVLNYRKKEIVHHVSEIEHELVREAMRKTGVTSGIEITTLADIPSEGSGLGSSSTVLVGLLQALYLHQGVTVDAERLAQEACEIEINTLQKPIGKQDQFIAAFGGLRQIKFNQDDTVFSESLELDKAGLNDFSDHLMLFFTGITRSSGDILDEQKQNLTAKEKTLHQLVAMAASAVTFIRAGRWEDLGKLLDESWHLKKQLASGVTTLKIDQMYELALAAGAWGGKIAGAGGGGFLLLIVPSDKKSAIRKALRAFKELPINLERDGSKVIFNARRN